MRLEGGTSAAVQDVDYIRQASRSTLRPPYINVSTSRGAYIAGGGGGNGKTGLMAGTAANAPFFFWRWQSTSLCIVRRVTIHGAVVTGFTAAQEIGIQAFIARSFTGDLTGGVAFYAAGSIEVPLKRTSYGTTSTQSARIASAAALAGGTYTNDTQPFMGDVRKTLAAAAAVQDTNLRAEWAASATVPPIILANDEGIVAQLPIALGAGGTLRCHVGIEFEKQDTPDWEA